MAISDLFSVAIYIYETTPLPYRISEMKSIFAEMIPGIKPIDSPETMAAAIRLVGIIPFVRNTFPGCSVEELTAPGSWFWDDDAEGVLGPWDWKIEVIAEGDIAYGKFIRNKAAFATVEWYRHLMNWRRSQPRYRMALGEEYTLR